MPIIIVKKKLASPPPVPIKKAYRPLDSTALWVMEQTVNAAIPWWLMASWSYYIKDHPMLSDNLYDQMAAAMLEAWHQLEHMHKHLITEEDLRAGSLYSWKEFDYPCMIRSAAQGLIKQEHGVDFGVQNPKPLTSK